MDHPLVYKLYYLLVRKHFSVLRFNFRGVGRSEGRFDGGVGELADAASALDWVQSIAPESQFCWIVGVSFGAWIGMQLLMRRPEIDGFIAAAPPASVYDFSFLSPCPTSGLFVHGNRDGVTPRKLMVKFVEHIKVQKTTEIKRIEIPDANHFFEPSVDAFLQATGAYIDVRLAEFARDPGRATRRVPLRKGRLTVTTPQRLRP